MKFKDYTFDGDYLLCSDVKIETALGEEHTLLLKIGDLSPFSLVQMIKSWDEDVILALIEEIKPEEAE